MLSFAHDLRTFILFYNRKKKRLSITKGIESMLYSGPRFLICQFYMFMVSWLVLIPAMFTLWEF